MRDWEEEYVMKKWKNPEMKLFSVKMEENIAASGETVEYLTGTFRFTGDGEGNPRSAVLKYVIAANGRKWVQNTVYAGGTDNINRQYYDEVVLHCGV